MPIEVSHVARQPIADSHFASVVLFNGALRWLSSMSLIAQTTVFPSSKPESLLMIVAGLVTALRNKSKRTNLTKTKLNRTKP
jgi:hypothetical protein